MEYMFIGIKATTPPHLREMMVKFADGEYVGRLHCTDKEQVQEYVGEMMDGHPEWDEVIIHPVH